MRRASLKMRLIDKKKPRMATFKKRKQCMMKKLHELTTLCDVGACMIIYDPDEGATSIWPPENPSEVHRLIDAYYKTDSGRIKSHGVADFFGEKTRQVENATLQLRKKNQNYYDDRLNFLDENQLRDLSAALRLKSEMVRSRIQFLKQEYETKVMLGLNFAQLHNDFTQFQESIDPATYYSDHMVDDVSAAPFENDFIQFQESINPATATDSEMVRSRNQFLKQEYETKLFENDFAQFQESINPTTTDFEMVEEDSDQVWADMIDGMEWASMENVGCMDGNINYWAYLLQQADASVS